MSERHVVLGASGGIGGALVAELAGSGRTVRAVTRTGALRHAPAGVEVVAARTSDPDALTAAITGATTVYHAAQPDYTRWVEEFPAMNDAIVDATARAGADLVVADNLYMYGPGASPMREDTPPRATDKKGALRARLAASLLGRHAAGDLRVTIGRASDYYGPGGVGSSLGMPVFSALLSSDPVQWIGSLDAPHTAHFLPDLAHGLIVLAEAECAYGRVWHLPAAPPITGRQFLDLAASGRPYDVLVANEATARAIGIGVPMIAELAEIAYQWSEPFVSDASAFAEAFGPQAVTAHEIAVPLTAAWFEQALSAIANA